MDTVRSVFFPLPLRLPPGSLPYQDQPLLSEPVSRMNAFPLSQGIPAFHAPTSILLRRNSSQELIVRDAVHIVQHHGASEIFQQAARFSGSSIRIHTGPVSYHTQRRSVLDLWANLLDRVSASRALSMHFPMGSVLRREYPKDETTATSVFDFREAGAKEATLVLKSFQQRPWQNVKVIIDDQLLHQLLLWSYEIYSQETKRLRPDYDHLMDIQAKIKNGKQLSDEERSWLRGKKAIFVERMEAYEALLDVWRKAPVDCEFVNDKVLRDFCHDLIRCAAVWSNFTTYVDFPLKGRAMQDGLFQRLIVFRGGHKIQYALTEGSLVALSHALAAGVGIEVHNKDNIGDFLAIVHPKFPIGIATDIIAEIVNHRIENRDSDKPEKKIDLSLQLLSDGAVEINVSDNGLGRQDGGTLMPVVSSLHSLDWGSLWLNSQPGEGSTLRFVIPALHIVFIKPDLKTQLSRENESPYLRAQRYRTEGFIELFHTATANPHG
ncbi:MAG: hypothetical protein HY540_06410 [Deltaproteobacteria bacterium]|nr:hypothetical protein [Deltaproteobacteria bacterium]